MLILWVFAWSPLTPTVWAGGVSYRQLTNHTNLGADVASIRALLTNTSVPVVLPGWGTLQWFQVIGSVLGAIILWMATMWQCQLLQKEAKVSIELSRRHVKADQRNRGRQAENISLNGLSMIQGIKASTPRSQSTSRSRQNLIDQFDAAASPSSSYSSSSRDLTH
ncbi:hypothetical protein TYRP_016407 [Tyrophagus putrescentiae]|nr:hypothetical protein TYRP_016407 [Tyrophagus putrescentiae]